MCIRKEPHQRGRRDLKNKENVPRDWGKNQEKETNRQPQSERSFAGAITRRKSNYYEKGVRRGQEGQTKVSRKTMMRETGS